MIEIKGPVYIVDDELDVRESLQFLLESYGYQITSFGSGKTFLQGVDLSAAGCVLLDSRMPEMRGQEVHLHLIEANSPLSVIFLTGHGDVPMAVSALKEGATDFFQKPVDGEELVAAIERALPLSHQATNKQVYLTRFQSLSKREKQVLHLLAKGHKNQQMADELHLSLRTIEVHRSNIMKKLQSSTVADLMLNYSSLIKEG